MLNEVSSNTLGGCVLLIYILPMLVFIHSKLVASDQGRDLLVYVMLKDVLGV